MLVRCPECGAKLSTDAAACPKCGKSVDLSLIVAAFNEEPLHRTRSRAIHVLLGLFLGGLGAHSFYAGRAWGGVGQIALCALGFVWAPAWLALALWVVVEILAVRHDHEGVPMS